MNLKEFTDLDLIIFLVAKKYEIVTTKREGNKSIVYLEDTPELRKEILSFVNGNEIINITEYQAAERRVKTLLYTNKNKL